MAEFDLKNMPHQIVVSELASGWKVDVLIIGVEPPYRSGPPFHFPQEAQAREFARRAAFILSAEVVDGS
ncbi:MAG TPA: hypothetical protein VHG29_10250 [Novosphingobium sp.]|nr:hypothetical protein [Novosphingobium sp.]